MNNVEEVDIGNSDEEVTPSSQQENDDQNRHILSRCG
jgi:hypothetical protein